jgi:hypothetical protein
MELSKLVTLNVHDVGDICTNNFPPWHSPPHNPFHTPNTVIAGNISLIWENSARYGEMLMPFPHDYVSISLSYYFVLIGLV